jgi:parallel beta-helix repeat protein
MLPIAANLYDPLLLLPDEDEPLISVIQNGWTPILAIVDRVNLDNSVSYVMEVSDWMGGFGEKPATGFYIGTNGLVKNINNAKDILPLSEVDIKAYADGRAVAAINAQLPYLQTLLASVFTGFIAQSAPDNKVLGTPAIPTVYYGGAGTYTVPNGTIVVTANINLFFWKADGSPWTYLQVPINVDLSGVVAKSDIKSVTGKNLYNKNSDLLGVVVSYETGELDFGGYTNNLEQCYCSQVIPLDPTSDYYLSGRVNKPAVMGINILNQDGTIAATVSTLLNGKIDKGGYFIQFTSAGFGGSRDLVQLEKGSTQTAYEPYKDPTDTFVSVLNGVKNVQNIPAKERVIKEPNLFYAHEICSGNGTEATPYTFQDNAAGINRLLFTPNDLTQTRGKVVKLVNGRFNLNTPILFNHPNSRLQGDIANYPKDPNGITESQFGTKVVQQLANSSAIIISGATRYGWQEVNQIGFVSVQKGGDGNPDLVYKAQQNSGLFFNSAKRDQNKFSNLSFNNFSCAIYGDANTELDTAIFERINLDGNGQGFHYEGTGFFCTLRDMVIADCPEPGLFFATKTFDQLFEWTFDNLTLVRNGGGIADPTKNYSFVWGGHNSTITRCKFHDNGSYWKGGNNNNNLFQPAGHLSINGSNNVISNNVMNKCRRNGIELYADRNMIINNTILNNGVDGVFVSSNKNLIQGNNISSTGQDIHIVGGDSNFVGINILSTITIESGATNTVVQLMKGQTLVNASTSTYDTNGNIYPVGTTVK